MDVQKLSAPSAASVSPTPRPVTRPTVESGGGSAELTQARLPQIEHLLANAFPPDLKLKLDIDRTTNTVVGIVVNRDTGELVRQIPSEEMINLLARSAEVNAILDKKV